MTFRSLRWRIASYYAGALVLVIVIVGVVLSLALRTILLDEAHAKVERVGQDIAQLVSGETALSAMGAVNSAALELTATGALDHWAGPTTFVEIDSAAGDPIGKSTNMGSSSLGPAVYDAPAVVYASQNVASLGRVLVRDEAIRYPGVALTIRVAESLASFDDTLARARTTIALVVAVAGIAVVTGSFLIASSALEPIARLGAAMGEISADRLGRRLGWAKRRDELGALAASFDAMLERLEEGFARERQFVSDASHELKTPLTIINANAQLLERWGDGDPAVRSDSLHAIRSESSSLAQTVNNMLLLARASSGDAIPRETVSLAAIVGEAVETASARARDRGLDLAYDAPEDVAVSGDAGLLRQLFANLIDNAVKFTERGGVRVTTTREGDRAVVRIVDTGIGIEEAALDRVFDRFYRTDASRDRTMPGTGLGLAIVRSIARVHAGTVGATRRPQGGTEFRVDLPALTRLQ